MARICVITEGIFLGCAVIWLANERCHLKMEARVGIEPTHKGFADLSLTAWVPRHLEHCTARVDGTQPGICDFPITPASLACKNRDFHHAARAATTFRLNPTGNPATSGGSER